MAMNWKALATGFVGAVGGLGAVSLAAQSGVGGGEPWDNAISVSNETDIAIRTQSGIWHLSGGRIRHCRWIESSFGSDVNCTAWR